MSNGCILLVPKCQPNLPALFSGISERLDVAFALDSSDVVSRPSFSSMKDFVNGIIKGYNISANQTRVSLVTYGNAQVNSLEFGDGIRRSVVEQALYEMMPVGGKRKLPDAIKYISENLFRSNVITGKVLVLIVNGAESQLKDKLGMEEALMDLKAKNVELVVVGIGKGIGDKLKGITDPEKTIAVDDAYHLKSSFPEVVEESTKAAGGIFISILIV